VIHVSATFLICLAGSMLQGATGFGMALVCMALMPLVMPLDAVQVVVMWLGTFSAFMIFWQLKKHLDWKLVWIPLIAVTVMRYVGVWLVSGGLELALIKALLGAVLILLAIYLAFVNKRLSFKPSPFTGLVAGVLSGLTGGMFNISGPPMAAYMFKATDDKMKYSACLQLLFFVGGLSNAVFRWLQGTLVPKSGMGTMLACIAAGLVAGYIGSRVGVGFLKRLDQKPLSIAVYSVMAASGAIYILQGLGVLA